MKKTLSAAALIIASCLLTLGVAEISARWWLSHQQQQVKEKCHRFDYGAFGGSRGFSLNNAYYEPHSVVNHCGGEYDYDYHIDKNGFRNHQNYRSNPRILAIGDSFTFGFGVKDEEAFPALIGAYNAGMWGNPFDVQFRSFMRNVDLLKPDIVIWGIYAPHIITMMDGDWSKYCPGDMNIAVDSSIAMRMLSWFPFQAIHESALGGLVFKSLAISKIGLEKNSLFVRRNCYETKEALLFDRNIGSTRYTSDPKVNEAYKVQLATVLGKMESNFRDAKRVADQRGIKIVFLFIPSRLYLGVNDGKIDLRGRYEDALMSPDRPRHLVENAITNAGFVRGDILDLGAPLLAEPDWRKNYFLIDAHWNAEGHKYVARSLQKKLGLPLIYSH